MPPASAHLPPGPRWPALASTIALQRDPIRVLTRASERHGETFSLGLLPLGRVVATSSPTLVKRMLTGDAAIFRAGAATRSLLPILGERSLIVRDGEGHRDRRRAMLSAFGPHVLEQHTGALDRLAAEHIARWPTRVPFAALPRARRLAFDAIATVVGLRGTGVEAEVEARLAALVSPPVGPAIWLRVLRRRMWGRGPWAVLERRTAGIDTLLRRALEQPHASHRPAAAAGHLLDLRRRGVIATYGEVLEELRTLLLVGHETATAAIAWTVLTVAQHPEALARLGDERMAEAVVQEALRLNPPVVDVVREIGEPLQIGRHEVPAGTVLVALPPLVHRRADLYEAPDDFRPERFLERRPDSFTWIPFGGGMRRCLGATLAVLELKAVLRALAAAGRLRPASGEQERARLKGTTLLPHRGACVVLDP